MRRPPAQTRTERFLRTPDRTAGRGSGVGDHRNRVRPPGSRQAGWSASGASNAFGERTRIVRRTARAGAGVGGRVGEWPSWDPRIRLVAWCAGCAPATAVNRYGLDGACARRRGCADGDLVVDVSSLEFIDVAGVRTLVEAARALEQGRHLIVRRASEDLCDLVELAGWDRVPGLALEKVAAG
ncbi:STAS domain-containing protein [Embleya sp. NPDC020886]|uniref:STAS domain-containing protein n=1 Tax=Embleya sp. NPDC020886 TaxID=3363980 RepID=UPI0037B9AF59